jgi:diguanylate cyclase (GGDEF)-like protein/hemerythrin-like metal-binding protein
VRVCALDPTRQHVLATTRGLRDLFLLDERADAPFLFTDLVAHSDRGIAEHALETRADESLLHGQRTDGSTFLAELRFDGDLVSVEDVSVRRAAEERLRVLALHDPLTGLPNRVLLQDRVRLALLETRRDHGLLAVMVLDLDQFKPVNDLYGHRVGDEVLRVAARRFTRCARATDTIARIGGDEFVMVAPVARREDAALLAGRVVQALGEPIRVGERLHPLGVSVGISVSPDDGDDLDELFVRADAAMYRAKRAGSHVAFAENSGSEVLALTPLEWQQGLEVGLPLVDREHKGLVAALNRVVAVVSSRGEVGAVLVTLEELVETTRAHFETEERLMEAAGYDGLSAHATEHRNLLSDLEVLRTTTDFGGGVTITLRHLEQWLLGHIGAFDADMARALLDADDGAALVRH